MFGRVKGAPYSSPSGMVYAPFVDTFQKNRSLTPLQMIYENLSTAYACAMLNAELVASTPLRLYIKTERGGPVSKLASRGQTRPITTKTYERLSRSPELSTKIIKAANIEEVTHHPLLDLLSKPNGKDGNSTGMNQYNLICITQLYQEIIGRAYWYLPPNGPGGTPSAIWIMASQMMTEYQDKTSGNMIDRYYFSGGGERQEYSPEVISPFRMPDLYNPYLGGMSPLRAVLEQVRNQRYIDAHISALLQNQGRPSAIWSPKATQDGFGIGEAEASRVRSYFRQLWSMAGANGIMVTESPGSLQMLTWPTKDIMDPKHFAVTKTAVCNGFGVPISKLDRGDASLSGAQTGDYAHAKDAGVPRCNRMQASLNTFVVPRWDDSGMLFVAFDSPIPEYTKFETEIMRIGLATGAITRQEFRDWRGMDKAEWAEIPMAPKTMSIVNDDGSLEPDPENPDARAGNGDANRGGRGAQGTTLSGKPKKKKAVQAIDLGNIKDGHAENLPDGQDLAADMRREFEKQRAIFEIKHDQERKKEELLLLLLLLLPSIMSVMRRHLHPVAMESMNTTLDALGIKHSDDARRLAMDDAEARLDKRIEWAANEINETTAEELEAAIGETLPGMEADAINKVFERAIDTRAEMIGDTEAVAGVLAAANESGDPLLKQWVTEQGACPICLDLEAEGPIPLNVLFGGEFEAPGAHPRCRCSIELTRGV